jgi:hypothetical protein
MAWGAKARAAASRSRKGKSSIPKAQLRFRRKAKPGSIMSRESFDRLASRKGKSLAGWIYWHRALPAAYKKSKKRKR